MAKEQVKTKVSTKITSFEDVQRSLLEVQKQLNALSNSINKVAEDYVKESEGKSGDLKLTKKANGTYNLEACTDDGWKKFFTSNVSTADGKSEVYLDDKPRVEKLLSTSEKTAALDSRYIPRTPDYDSGWVNAPSESSGGTLNHGISGVDPNAGKVLDYIVYFRNAQSDSADKWTIWNGHSQDDNDHFSFGVSSTQFLYHQDSDDGDTLVKWGIATGASDYADISFRIFAWKLF